MKARIEWDAEREIITNHEKAMGLFKRSYRKPWEIPDEV